MFQETVATRKILSPKVVAEFMGVREKTICKMAHAGKMPAFKFGGQWRFDEETIRQWINQQMIKNCANIPT